MEHENQPTRGLPQNARDEVVNELRAAIIDGRFESGTRIVISSVASSMNLPNRVISRAPTVLAAEGLVEGRSPCHVTLRTAARAADARSALATMAAGAARSATVALQHRPIRTAAAHLVDEVREAHQDGDPYEYHQHLEQLLVWLCALSSSALAAAARRVVDGLLYLADIPHQFQHHREHLANGWADASTSLEDGMILVFAETIQVAVNPPQVSSEWRRRTSLGGERARWGGRG